MKKNGRITPLLAVGIDSALPRTLKGGKKNMNEKYLFGIGIVLAVLLVFAAPASAENRVYFDPDPSSCAAPGETIIVTMWVDTVNGTAGFQDDLYFDPNVVNITDISPGYYDSYWMVIPYYEQNFIRFGGDSPDFRDHTGVMILANVTLEAICPGTSALDHKAFPIAKLYDEYGNSVPDQVWYDGTFTCEGEIPPPEPDTYTKNLVTGWNLISLPLTNETDMTVANIIDTSLSGSYDALNKYNATSHNFVALGSSDTMENGVGYFIHMIADDTWTYQGTAYTSMTASLVQGLNMVGWTNTSASLPGALGTIAGNYRYVARWDASSQSYEVYLPGAPDVFNDFETMERGEGYFIAATAGCTLTYP